MAVVKRAAWHARPASGVGNQISAHPLGVAVHYSEGNVGAQAHGLCAPRVLAIQRFHMTARGYADIAYSLLVCQHGQVYEGRGTGKGSAANGTTKANLDYYAVCALIGSADKPTPQLLNGIGEAIAICRKAGAGQRVIGHRDLFATACPGDALYVLVNAGHWNAVTPTAPRPSRPAPAQPTAPLEDTMKPWFARCKDNTIVIVGPTGVRKLTGPQWQTWTNLGYKLEPNMQAMDVGPFNAMIASLGGIVK
jgi:hypothetical protein